VAVVVALAALQSEKHQLLPVAVGRLMSDVMQVLIDSQDDVLVLRSAELVEVDPVRRYSRQHVDAIRSHLDRQ
jgi:hypothetical protein